jgi:hypothetical protein
VKETVESNKVEELGVTAIHDIVVELKFHGQTGLPLF